MKLIFFALFLFIGSVATALYFSMGRSNAKKEYQQCVQAGGELEMAEFATCTWPNSEDQVTIDLDT